MRVILFRGKRTDECEEYNCCGANCLYVEWDGICFTNRLKTESSWKDEQK